MVLILFEEALRTLIDSSRGELLVLPIKVKSLEDMVVDYRGQYELRKDVEAELPRWLAYILARKGKVELAEEEKIDVEKLANLEYLEALTITKPSQLQEVPQDFYLKAELMLRNLEEKVRTKPTSEIIEEYRNLETHLRGFMRSRIKKILMLSLVTEEPKEALARMTPEEKVLYWAIRNIVRVWVKETIGLEY